MDENVKKEFAGLQKEMAELQKTIENCEDLVNTEGAELKDIPDDSNEDPKEDEMDIYCYQCFSSIRVKKDIPAGTVVTCPTCESQQKYWDCECPLCHIQHHPDEPHPERAIRFNMMVMGKSEEDIAAFLENLNKKCNLPSTDKNSGLNKISELALVPVMMGKMFDPELSERIKDENKKMEFENVFHLSGDVRLGKIRTERTEDWEDDNNENNEMKSSGKLQEDMVCIPPKGDNRDNEMKTKALQGSFVDISSYGLLGALKKLLGK